MPLSILVRSLYYFNSYTSALSADTVINFTNLCSVFFIIEDEDFTMINPILSSLASNNNSKQILDFFVFQRNFLKRTIDKYTWNCYSNYTSTLVKMSIKL